MQVSNKKQRDTAAADAELLEKRNQQKAAEKAKDKEDDAAKAKAKAKGESESESGSEESEPEPEPVDVLGDQDDADVIFWSKIFFCPSSYLIFYSHVIEKEWKNNGWKLCTAGHFLLVYREISVGWNKMEGFNE